VPKGLLSPDKRIVIKIIPHDAESVYKLELTHRVLAVLLACVVAVITALFVNHEAQVRAAQAQVNVLEKVTTAQRQQLVNFSNQTNHMWRQLHEIQHENQEIRRLTATPGPRAPVGSAKGSKPTALLPPPQEVATVGLHAPPSPTLWSRMVEWIRANQDSTTSFASESAQMSVLTIELDHTYSEALIFKGKALALAETRREAEQARQRALDAMPSIWPTEGAITGCFCYRSYPDSEFHPGVDIVNDYGSPVYATASGTVILAGWDSGYGEKIEIDHGNGYVTWYGHNSELLVSTGQSVRKGELIARVGSTGFATGPHVHYEVLENGTPVNPVPFLSGSVQPQLASN
jgi:murein DD-endopeptidase MepM/ murein hydrolase activator NlpD/predicted outer membrane lipoprotein